ncbi:MAG TPA: hypothetical protein VFS20_27770 [Longimicrobium sp.]|nr:hypothetical protein [Longimicrobium sp.]
MSATAGHQWNSALFDHTASFTAQEQQILMSKRVRVPQATMAGARVTARMGGAWMVYADVAHGSARMSYVDDARATLANGTVLTQLQEMTRDARITSFGAGVGRGIPLPRGLPELELTRGGAVQRFGIDRLLDDCLPGPCGADPWESSYSVPSVRGGLTLRQVITHRLGLELRSAYTIGRIDNESLNHRLPPGFAAYEAPGHQTVRSGDVSLGLWVRP